MSASSAPTPDPVTRRAGLRHQASTCHRDAGGFTLIEIVVALIIFALVFGAISRVIQTGFRQSRVADVTAEASLVARSLMERIGTEIPIGEGAIEGVTGTDSDGDRYRWQIAMEPIDIGQQDPIAALVRVVIAVAWGDGPAERVELETLRIAPLE